MKISSYFLFLLASYLSLKDPNTKFPVLPLDLSSLTSGNEVGTSKSCPKEIFPSFLSLIYWSRAKQNSSGTSKIAPLFPLSFYIPLMELTKLGSN